jgi:hypothetical protein
MAISARKEPDPPTPAPSVSPSEPEPNVEMRAFAAFERLRQSSVALNTVSDELNKPIEAIEAALRQLSPGVSAWVNVRVEADADAERAWVLALGYAKVSNKWGLAVKTTDGFFDDENPDISVWPIAESPRHHRLEVVDHLPALLDALARTADVTAEALKNKMEITTQIARAVTRVAAGKK